MKNFEKYLEKYCDIRLDRYSTEKPICTNVKTILKAFNAWKKDYEKYLNQNKQ